MFLDQLSLLPNVTDYLLRLDLYAIDFEFTEFQNLLLKLFTAVLCVIAALIVVYWCKYGEVISERFIRPSESSN